MSKIAVALLALATGAAISASAQALPTGFRVEAGGGVIGPVLGSGNAGVFSGAGSVSPGITAHYGMGYDTGHFGATLMLDVSQHRVGGQSGNILALGLLAHYRLDAVVASDWSPMLTAGYVREGVGGVFVTNEDVPADLRSLYRPGGSERHEIGILGNALRLGVGAERNRGGPVSLYLSASGDFVDFGSVTWHDAEISHYDALGTGMVFRLEVAARWRGRN